MRIKNWAKFQHFKDRTPPWIKLYRTTLDDLEWHELEPLSAKVLVMLWLIASEDDGRLPSIKKLSFRLRMSETQISKCISNLSHWLEQDDISSISNSHHDGPLETEVETETEQETKKEKTAPRKRSVPPVDKPMATIEQLEEAGMPADVAAEFIAHKAEHKAPLTERAWRDHLAESTKAGWTPLQAAEKVMAKNWRGFEAKYVADEQAPTKSPLRATYAEQDEQARRRRWEEMTGQKWPTDGGVIDMENPQGRIAG